MLANGRAPSRKRVTAQQEVLTVSSGLAHEEEMIRLHFCAAKERTHRVQVVLGKRPRSGGFLDVCDRCERTRKHSGIGEDAEDSSGKRHDLAHLTEGE